MDAEHFDSLVKALASSTPRRRLVRLAMTLPLVGGLASVLGDEATEAHGRRRRRKKHHKHRKGDGKDNRKGKRQEPHHGNAPQPSPLPPSPPPASPPPASPPPPPSCPPACGGKCGGADGCGGTCPDACVAPQTCGGGGTPNVCGCTPDCTGKCGGASDDCGGTCAAPCPGTQLCCNEVCVANDTTNCGTCGTTCSGTTPVCNGTTCVCIASPDSCTAPQTCGGGGTAGQCGCTPVTQCPAGQQCGTASDGCSGTISCGSCTVVGQICNAQGTCECAPNWIALDNGSCAFPCDSSACCRAVGCPTLGGLQPGGQGVCVVGDLGQSCTSSATCPASTGCFDVCSTLCGPPTSTS